MIDEFGSRLLMEVFNRMTAKQKNDVGDELAQQIAGFMVTNGYKFVFDKWYLQEEPKSE